MNGEFVDLVTGFIPLCTLAAGALIAAIKMRPANKTADAAITEGQWKRLIEWNQRLQDECEACHRERDEARAEALKWKAIAEGIGQNRQEEAAHLAAKRLAEKQGKGGAHE